MMEHCDLLLLAKGNGGDASKQKSDDAQMCAKAKRNAKRVQEQRQIK
jgi:hypothetical protein